MCLICGRPWLWHSYCVRVAPGGVGQPGDGRAGGRRRCQPLADSEGDGRSTDGLRYGEGGPAPARWSR